MDINGHFHMLAILFPGKASQETIKKEEEVIEYQSQSGHSRREIIFWACQVSNQNSSPSSPQPSHYTNYANLAISITYI
jgi:hypothetical protein